jgi:hypothetical protein
MNNPTYWMDWVLRCAFLIIIWFLISGTLGHIELIVNNWISFYFTRRQEAIDKMIRDGLDTSKHYN